MRKIVLALLGAGTVALAGCATNEPPATRAEANAHLAAGGAAATACGTYGLMDRDGNGHISRAEWDAYRYGNGFYADSYYNRDYWTRYYDAFDPTHSGYITNENFFGNGAWTAIDRNGNGVIDDDEWVWWPH